MSFELIYTSVPRGLKPGSSGFCIAAATAALSRQVMTQLEQLSGYEFCYNISDPKAHLNPVNYSHVRITVAGEARSVLSRVAFSGADYSGRTNKIAHHFLLEPNENVPNGPGWMMARMAEGIFKTKWSEEAQEMPARAIGSMLGDGAGAAPRPAARWQRQTGDAGWAGILVKAFREDRNVPGFVLFDSGMDLLPLFEESLLLLTPAERWLVCFSSYYTGGAAGCQVHWRGVLAGSQSAREIGRFPSATVIDLTKKLPAAPANEYTEAARRGRCAAGPAPLRHGQRQQHASDFRTRAPWLFDRHDRHVRYAEKGTRERRDTGRASVRPRRRAGPVWLEADPHHCHLSRGRRDSSAHIQHHRSPALWASGAAAAAGGQEQPRPDNRERQNQPAVGRTGNQG